ncbi:hypothetical protein [Alteromonas ponticola]|uniref:Protein CopB n=1 Tax=Alteromonas ponticola TaxID=2720613 RepID=A0ABX1R031_9ALTE|nr:hypothetical protein [Alteromonas ponticola]NMH58417.1 hypothetical protein [Alteromonas ponticola]
MKNDKSTNTSANAEKQRRFRARQQEAGKKLIRGYVTPQAQECYDEIRQKTGWSDSETLSNALRVLFAAYKCGQIKLLNEWLKDHKR